MRLQKQKVRKRQNKQYFKWVVLIPPKIIEKLKWKKGQELKHEVKNKKLILEKK